MYEIKRILLNKKTMISFMVMFLINMAVFLNQPEDEDIFGIEKPHIEYINNYSKKYEAIKNNAKMLLSGKEYSDADSFSVRNINKTLEDFAVTENIQLTNTDETAADSLINFKFTDYAMLVLVISIVMSMYDERKKSVWDYVYSTKNGREKIAANKLYGLSAGVIISALLMYMSNVVCANIKYGSLGDMSRAAQSNENFENIVLKISLGGALAAAWIIKVSVLILMGIVLWLLISNLRGQVIPFLIYGSMMFAEYYMYSETDIHSVWKNLKYINIFGVLDSQEMLGTYVNLNLFGYAVNRINFMCIVLFILLMAAVLLMICFGKKRPFVLRKSNRALGIFKRSTSIFGQEIYKTFITQKIWFVFILYIIGVCIITRPHEIMYDYGMVVYNQYMENLSGDVTQQKLTYLENEIALWNNQIEELIIKQGSETESYEMQKISEKIKNVQTAKDVTEKIYDEALELMEIKADGTNVGFVNSIGYDRLIGGSSKSNAYMDSIVILVFMILTVAVVWSYDNQCEMSESIKACINGRGKYAEAKYGVAAVLVILAVLILFAFRFAETDIEYGMNNLSMSIRSLSYFREGTPNVSIGVFLGIFLIIRCVNSFLTAVIIMYISSKAKNNIVSIVINIAVFLLPACMYYIGQDLFAYVSTNDGIAVSSMWQNRNIISMGFVIRETVMVLIGVLIAVWHTCGVKLVRRTIIKRKYRCD